jgi:hypothetical protein
MLKSGGRKNSSSRAKECKQGSKSETKASFPKNYSFFNNLLVTACNLMPISGSHTELPDCRPESVYAGLHPAPTR